MKHILPSCIPRSRTRKVRQAPIYLHVWSWKSPQGIEAQAGVLYYNRPPNLQQKQYQASRKVLPDSFPYSVLVSCIQDNKNNSAAVKALPSVSALTTQPTASPAGAEQWQGGPLTEQNEQSCTALALTEQWDHQEGAQHRQVENSALHSRQGCNEGHGATARRCGDETTGTTAVPSEGSTCTQRKDAAAVRAAAGPHLPNSRSEPGGADLPGGLTALLHGDLVRLPLVLGHWGHTRAVAEDAAGPGRAERRPPTPANLRSIFFATNVYGEESPRI